jgi:hypothetical protein
METPFRKEIMNAKFDDCLHGIILAMDEIIESFISFVNLVEGSSQSKLPGTDLVHQIISACPLSSQ